MAEIEIVWVDPEPLEVVGQRCAIAGIKPIIRLEGSLLASGDVLSIEGTSHRLCIERRATLEEIREYRALIGSGVLSSLWPAYVVTSD